MISVNLQTEIALLLVTKLCGTEYCRLSIICRQNTVFPFSLFHFFSLSIFAFEGQRITPYVLFFCCSGLVQQKRGGISHPVRNYCHVHAASLVWRLDTFQCFQVVN
jgi:hypothetical protein